MSRCFWRKFLIDAGIPVKAAESYTSAFVDNRIAENMISDLSKSVLMDLGITIIGDVIAILKHAIHLTEEASAERQLAKLSKKRHKPPDKKSEKKSSPEHGAKKGKKEEAAKKKVVVLVKKTEDNATPKNKTDEIKKTTEKKTKAPSLAKPAPLEREVEKPPRKVRIVEQPATKESDSNEPKQAPTEQVKRKTVKIEVPAVRTVSVPTKPAAEQKTTRVITTGTSRSGHVTQQSGHVTHQAGHATHQSGHVTHQSGHATHQSGHVTHPSGHVTHQSGHATHQSGHVTHQSGHVTHQAGHVTHQSGHVTHQSGHVAQQQRVNPAAQTVHLVRRRHDSFTSEEESDSSSCGEERSPVIRRVFPGHASTSPVIVRQLPGDTIPSKSIQEEPAITRNVTCDVMRRVQTVRCVSPDSTTDITPSKPKQTTTVILSTKGKCSVRPVSPPEDMMSDRKRKVLPRGDGKSTLTRVVQRHLDSSSPNSSPKRHKNKDKESLLSEKYNSFRSDAEGMELRNVNKFRSEVDTFDIVGDVTDKRVQVRRKVRSRSMSGGRVGRRISSRLGGVSRGPDLRRSLPATVGGVAARVFSENRLVAADRASPRTTKSEGFFRSHRNELAAVDRSSPRTTSTTESEGFFRSHRNETSIFSRLGKY